MFSFILCIHTTVLIWLLNYLKENEQYIKMDFIYLWCKTFIFFFLILTRGYVFWFFKLILESEEERERKRERNIDWYPLVYAPARDWTCKVGLCPDQGSNTKPFGAWNDTQPTKPHSSGLKYLYRDIFKLLLLWMKAKHNLQNHVTVYTQIAVFHDPMK